MARHRVLIVEDEQDIAGLIEHTLERGGETEAHRGDERLVETRSVDVHVGRLRSSCAPPAADRDRVGLGYRFVD